MLRDAAMSVVCLLAPLAAAAQTASFVTLHEIDNPQAQYRWMDVADQLYATSYRDTFDYSQATVGVVHYTGAETLHGTLSAVDLKPHFAYQVKLVGTPGTQSNESIGLTGRWWQEEWNGVEWTNGQNLNDKGDGSSPNPNDVVYYGRRDIPDATSPTGLRYRFTGYLLFDYFITDESGDASVGFEADSSYHVLWKTAQRTPTAQDGPAEISTFTGGDPDPVSAYDVVYPDTTVGVFGEWERLPPGGVTLPPGDYEAQFVLTEESFHGGGLAGGWAGAMTGTVTFSIVGPAIPTVSPIGAVVLVLLLVTLGVVVLRVGRRLE